MKRILSLDGGGIRGVFSLMILRRIEALLREERGQPGLVLRDAFDFFAGTSTGAIIAAGLAWGMGVEELLELYRSRGREMFTKAGILDRYWTGMYDPQVIARLFKELFRDRETGAPAQLGTRHLWGDTPAERKYLLMVMRNATTGSAWPVCNNPAALYNDRALEDCNLEIPLWKLLRASTAAPVYFPPEEIRLGGRTDLFVDGGITPYNNPALIAVLMATLPGYRIGWEGGKDRLQVVSIGTGSTRARLTKQAARQVNNKDVAGFIIPAVLGTVAVEQDMMCRVLGHCVHGDAIDSEMGDLHGDGLLPTSEKKFSYVRYNRSFSFAEIAELEHRTGKSFSLDNTDLIGVLEELGEAYAAAHVRREHLFP
jgi:hypothetical protein